MLKYQFPAVKGCQAGKDYYICMVPLGLMSKIFATDSSDVPAEYRAQRKLNEARIPEICGYILSNRDSYVFSALAASVDGDMKFVPADSNENAGLLEIDMTASFLINDGQHRKAAIEAAIAEDESLKEETISIVLYKDQGLQRSQQMFTDLNKHAVTTSKSLNTLYESKDPVALITKKIVDTVNQILREIRTYRKLIAGIWPYEVGQPLTDWDRKRLDILIRFLDFDIVYPLLLAAVQLKQKTFADLVHMLEKFMFRHKSVCNLGHQKLSELYMQEAVKIRRDPENYRLTGLRTTLKEYIETECTDAVFKVGLSNLKYRTNGGNKPLRYLFSTLNEHIEWYRNGAVGVPAPQKGTVINYDNVTIEHIASQSPSAAVPGFTSENIHTLSNLTLLTNGENDRAKNKSYTAKKAIYHDSEYVINKYFDSVDDWSVESAKAWEQYLQEMVCKVFVV